MSKPFLLPRPKARSWGPREDPIPTGLARGSRPCICRKAAQVAAHRGDRGGRVSIQLGREGAPERAEDHKTLPRSSERHLAKVKKKHLEACLSVSALISQERK